MVPHALSVAPEATATVVVPHGYVSELADEREVVTKGTRACDDVDKMSVTVQSSLSGQVVACWQAEADATILAVKYQLSRKMDIHVERLILVWRSRILEDISTLRSLGAPRVVVLNLMLKRQRLALSADQNGQMRLWHLDSASCKMMFEGHSDSIKTLAVDWANMRAISGSTDAHIKLWDLNTGNCMRTFVGHTGTIRAIAMDWLYDRYRGP